MATLTIADLDNGKRDLQTVSEVANSRAASATTRFGQQTTTLYESIRRIQAHGDEVISNLGFRVPVPYASGLEITDLRFTVTGPDGKVYAPLSAPFTTGAWDSTQWYVLQNDLNDHKLLIFDALASAETAATTLPDGQVISVEPTFKTYTVYAGLLSDERPTNPAGVGTAGRSQQQRNTDIVSVRDFGAKGDGTGFDKDAFILAAVASKKALTAKYGGDIPRSVACEVFVPATGAKYILGSEVVPPGFDVVWYLDTGADFDDIDFLYGKVVRAGEKITANTYGLADTATTHSVGANSGHGMAGNFNLSTPSRLASYRSRDSVAQQHFASAPAPIARITGVTFTSTRVNFPEPLSETVIAKLRKGLVLDTTSAIASGGVTDGRDDLDNKWSGVVDGWDISGNWVSVTAWYRTGNTTTPETPTDNIVVINPVTLAMGAIDYASLGANSHGRWAIGGESDVVNNQGAVDPIPQDGSRFLNRRITIGRYVNAIGNYDKGTAGWVASGKWINGFQADAGSENAFAYYGTGRGLYLSQNPGTYIEVQNALGRMTYKQGPGGIDFFPAKGGGSAVGVSLRFGTGGSNVVDAAISVTGGSTVDAGGLVTFSAQQVHFNTGGSVTVSNTLRSNADNVSNLGLQSQRWKDLFLVNAPIVTSDEREKTTPKDIPNSMLDAWGEVNFFAWKWLSSVSEKGDAARIHYGPIAQHIRDAFIRHGLMTEESTDCLHAPLCYSEWSDAYENVMIEDTRVITYHCAETGKKKSFEEKYQRDTGERKLVMAAGNRWGIHADQCLFLEAAYQRREVKREREAREKLELFVQEMLLRIEKLES